MPDGSTNLEYEHLYVLSDNINGTWGSEIVNGAAEKDSIIYNNFGQPTSFYYSGNVYAYGNYVNGKKEGLNLI